MHLARHFVGQIDLESRPTSGKGCGLGLDIAYRIVVNRHDGAITVASQSGATTFQVRLPLGAQAAGGDENPRLDGDRE
ncbi:signal transduction histidine kinase [Paraburkholderia sp. 32]